MNVAISSVQLSPFSTEPIHRVHIRTAASCLASTIQAWLVDTLSDFSFEIASQDSIDKITPTRRSSYDRISIASGQALGLVELLQDAQAGGFISAHKPDVGVEFQRDLADRLSRLVRGFGGALASLLDEKKTIPAGRRKAHLPGTRPAKYSCAAIIAEAVVFLEHNGFPAPSQSAQHSAANALWSSWLPSTGWGSDRKAGWTRYFKAAGDDELAPLRREVCRCLTIRFADERARN
jgi:hypothetical protein